MSKGEIPGYQLPFPELADGSSIPDQVGLEITQHTLPEPSQEVTDQELLLDQIMATLRPEDIKRIRTLVTGTLLYRGTYPGFPHFGLVEKGIGHYVLLVTNTNDRRLTLVQALHPIPVVPNLPYEPAEIVVNRQFYAQKFGLKKLPPSLTRRYLQK